MSDVFPSIHNKLPIIFCKDIKELIQQYFSQQWYLFYKNLDGALYKYYFQSNDEEVNILIRNIEKYAFSSGIDNYLQGKHEYPKSKLYQKYIYKKGKKGKKVRQNVIIGQEILQILNKEIFDGKYFLFKNILTRFLHMKKRLSLEYNQLDTYDYLVLIGHSIKHGELRLN